MSWIIQPIGASKIEPPLYLITDTETGGVIGYVFTPEHAALVSTAPKLLAHLETLTQEIEDLLDGKDIWGVIKGLNKMLRTTRRVIAEAKRETEE